jgi:ABC-type Na+ transport system ATPase subunit NatA
MCIEKAAGIEISERAQYIRTIMDELQRIDSHLLFYSCLVMDMEELCSHLVVVNKGKILYEGGLQSFMAEFQSLEKAFQVQKNREANNV